MYPIGVILNSWPGANKNAGESEGPAEIGLATEKVSSVSTLFYLVPSCYLFTSHMRGCEILSFSVPSS